MKRTDDITRIMRFMLVIAGMALVPLPITVAWEGPGIFEMAGVDRSVPYAILHVGQTRGMVHRSQPLGSGRSTHPVPRVSLNQDRPHQGSLIQNPSRTVLPLILYPWIWGYQYGTMQTPEDVLVDYLEELNTRQELAREDAPPSVPEKPAPSPLIIEEQCGKYVRIAWPEPGVLFEPREEPSCPEGN